MAIDTSHASVATVERALRARGITGETRWFDVPTPTAVAAAGALGVEVGAIANSLVFILDGEPVLVMTSGAHRVDTEYLGDQLGGTLSRASAAVVRDATGQVIGGVAPTGHPKPLRTFVDAALAAFPELWAAAGHPHTVFPLTFDQLLSLTDAQIVTVQPGPLEGVE